MDIHIIEILKDYECWVPLFNLLDKYIQEKKSQEAYLLKAKILSHYVEQKEETVRVLGEIVETFKWDVSKVQEMLLSHMIAPTDYATQAQLWEHLFSIFENASDKINCLEILCRLYEKKLSQETQLMKTYDRLLELDPSNIKALKYLKYIFVQNNQWDKVAETLSKILQSLKRRSEHPRVALELSAVMLYQLDNPLRAIEILSEHTENSHLDSSQVRFDAFKRLEDWPGCLRVLHELLITVKDPHKQSVLHYKIGEINETLGERILAYKSYESAHELNLFFMEPYEKLTAWYITEENWSQLKKIIEQLSSCPLEKKSLENLRDLHERLSFNLKFKK